MNYIAERATFRLSALTVIALTAGLTVGRADLVQPTATLPPPAGVYTLPLVCITPVCLENANVSGFHTTSDVPLAGDELVTTTATFAADIFQNNSGVPGVALGPLSIAGTMDFTYFGRSVSIPLGTFLSQITDFDFMGTFNGHAFEVKQNPNMASTGMTTINQVFQGGPYQVSSFFDVFAELSIDNGPFVPGPLREATLTAVPEPSSGGLAALGLLGLVGIMVSRRRRIQ
jgi:MYXO-CTERM domain-containing protein